MFIRVVGILMESTDVEPSTILIIFPYIIYIDYAMMYGTVSHIKLPMSNND